MSWQRLPPELVEGIFDHLHDNKQALKVCSLVCKAWLHPAYRRLFHDAHLTLDRLRVAFDPRSESIAATFIRHLCIRYDYRHVWNETFSSLDGLRFITSLTIETLPWDEILPDIRSIISSQFIAITCLQLREVYGSTFSEFAQLICTFRSLEKLILGSTHWHTWDQASPLLCLPPHLHALQLDTHQTAEILEWLTSFKQDLTLRNVSLLNPSDRQGIDTFLRVLGPSLESFWISLKETFCSVQLHHNTNLRSLHLDVWRRHGCETGLVPILSGVTSVHMEEISISILHFADNKDSPFHDLAPMEWCEVDAILSEPQFSNLDAVSVYHVRYNRPETQSPLEWFFSRLPLCHERGILRLWERSVHGPFI